MKQNKLVCLFLPILSHKNLPGRNSAAFLASESMKSKSVITLTSGVKFINLFFSFTDSWTKWPRAIFNYFRVRPDSTQLGHLLTPYSLARLLVPDTKHFFIVTYKWAQKARLFASGMIFQPSLMFASKAIAYPTEAPFRCSTLGEALALTHKHRLGWKSLPWPNSQAYWAHS